MHYPHRCTIARQTADGTPDAYGVPGTTTRTAYTRCRFISPKGGVRKLESGEHVYLLPSAILPAGTDIAEGDLLASDEEGYARTFTVVRAQPVYGEERIQFVRCDLEAVRP